MQQHLSKNCGYAPSATAIKTDATGLALPCGASGKRLRKSRKSKESMPNNIKMYWLHALTSLHVGSGRGVGFIDLPIMREKVTNWPFIPGSTVKGVVADAFQATEEARKANSPDGKLRKAAFGLSDDDNSNSGNSGALIFTDARLICLPVCSLFGTFAWVTSVFALQRLQRDLESAELVDNLQVPKDPQDTLLLPQGIGSILKDTNNNKVYFEDLHFSSREDQAVKNWAEHIAQWVFSDQPWQEAFKQRFAVIPNNSFDFLSKTGTEVNARVRIAPERKTVEQGALWYEESL